MINKRFFLNLILFNCITVTALLSGASNTVKSDEESWAPDFLIIGTQKGGTGALQQYINLHPNIIKNDRKELGFFDLQFDKGPEWYKDQFSPRTSSCFIIGQKRPYYLFHPLVPGRVHSLYPNVKLIIILRNPIERAYSQYWMMVRNGREPLFFENAIHAEPQRLEEESSLENPYYRHSNHQEFSYLARGIYIEQIEGWLQYFPRKQILVIFSSDLRNDPKKVMDEVFSFLGAPLIEIPQIATKTTHDHPPMDPATRQWLVDYFRPYNQKLEQFLEIKLNWDN